MIKVTRSPKPTVLERNQAVWTRALLGTTTAAQRKTAENKYRHREVKETLVKMFHGKCAYCESKVLHIDYGHIEHFRPKSRAEFRDLAFDWENLLLSCPICNGAEYKGDHFPDVVEDGPLVNPCDDNPDDHFEFVFDSTARLATIIGKTPRGRTTEKLLGLNRPDLRAYRSKSIMTLYVLSDYSVTDPVARALLEDACKDDAEYAAFARKLQELL